MRSVTQRVREASVTVDGEVVGSIETGVLILLGVERGDTEKDATVLANKIAGLRIFRGEDEADGSIAGRRRRCRARRLPVHARGDCP
jgi:D-tyrosyl-tRNA(Tyr) deacylase